MNIYVGGVNGVGKTSVVRAAAEALGFEYVHATGLLMKCLGFEGDYEKLRALTQSERNVKLRECIEDLMRRAEEKNKSFLLDAHYLGLVRGDIQTITADWIQKFDAVVLVTAPWEDVWERIMADAKERDRALFPKEYSKEQQKEMLRHYLDQTKEEFLRLAEFYKKPAIEIINRKDELQGSVNSLVKAISSLSLTKI